MPTGSRGKKFGHAAAFPLVVGHRRRDGGYERPVSAILAFTPPSGDRPLIQHNELGDPLPRIRPHPPHVVTRAEYARTSSETEIDFVEAPSQIMEHWTYAPEVLGRFARHYRTGDPMPADLLRQMIAARYVNIGLKTMFQVFYGQIDLGIHDGRAEPNLDEALELAFPTPGCRTRGPSSCPGSAIRWAATTRATTATCGRRSSATTCSAGSNARA